MNKTTGNGETSATGPVLPRKPKDRDFVQTREGMLFCVIGYLHPPDRYTAYLKYSPDPAGKWRVGDIGYRRELEFYHVSNVAKTIRLLEEHYPDYVFDCPVRGIRFSMVPHRSVARYYLPSLRLAEILADPQDVLEEETCALVDRLQTDAGLSREHLGVTGSLLTGSHNPAFSDIDLLVYGGANAARLRACIKEGGEAPILETRAEQIAEWCGLVSEQHGLSAEDTAYLAERRWNFGFFGQRYVSMHAIRADEEIRERYGDQIYRGRGAARILVTLSDVSEALFLPAIYQVENVHYLDGDPDATQVRQIVAYEGLYGDIAEVGERVEAYGKVECVDGNWYQLVVGATQPATGRITPVRTSSPSVAAATRS